MVTRQASGIRPRRPDESMSLLNDLFAKPLDPGYEDAAARRSQDAGSAAPMPRRSPALMFGMMALGLLLTMAALQVRNTASVVSSERQGLIERIHSEDAHVSQLQNTTASLESDISGLEDDLLRNSTSGQRLREEVQELQATSGAIAVTGPGAVVTVDDAAGQQGDEQSDKSRVLDIDLQQVINGLWAAGAEAISINGQRITGLTAIRQVNNVMKINYRPTNPPFEITAVGDSRSLPHRFGEGTGGQWLRYIASNHGIRFDVRSEDSLTIPAGNTPLVYAQPGEHR